MKRKREKTRPHSKPSQREDYVGDSELNLFRRAGFTGIAYSDGDLSEDRIYAAVRDSSDRSTFSVELARAITDWPSEYHLSRHRHCLIRPLGIKRGDRVLEFGAGCGAITRYLGELGAHVTAVEGAPRRALIAAERCRDLANVVVFNDDILAFKSEQRFDWILFVGLLEYAPVFAAGPDPVGNYLRAAANLLSENGRLVVAIENKLGIKYFSGCGEDHVGRPFHGIQGLYHASGVRTFARSELLNHLTRCGLEAVRFYYPFPDYKLPSVIISDRALRDPGFDAVDLLAFIRSRDYSGRRYRLFDEALVLREIAGAGLLGEFSNSFLAVGERHPREDTATTDLAACYAVDRKPQFATQTRFVRSSRDAIEVVKEPLLADGTRCTNLPDGSTLHQVLETIPYRRGRLSVWRLWEARAKEGELEEIVATLQPWFALLVSKSSQTASSLQQDVKLSDLTIPGRHIDLTPHNLIEADGELIEIDEEWRIDRQISLGWVVTRAVWHCLGTVSGFEAGPLRIADVIRALASACNLTLAGSDIAGWLEQDVGLQEAVVGWAAEKPTTDFNSNSLPALDRLTPRNAETLSIHEAARLRQRLDRTDAALAHAQALAIERAHEIQALSARMDVTHRALHEAQSFAFQRAEEIASLTDRLSRTDKALTEAQSLAFRNADEIGALTERLAHTDAALVEAQSLAFQHADETRALTERLARTDKALSEAQSLVFQRTEEIAVLTERLARTDAALAEAQSLAFQRTDEIAVLTERLARTQAALTEAQSIATQRIEEIGSLTARLARTDAALAEVETLARAQGRQIASLSEQLQATNATLAQTEIAHQKAESELAILQEGLRRLYGSTFWRWTHFLRRLLGSPQGPPT